MIISIVSGATGITLLRLLSELVGSNRRGILVTGVQLFDKSGFDGGVAYRTKSDHHLLNMKASKMPIRVGDDQEFLGWTRQVGLQPGRNDHLSRKLYQDYLHHVRQSAIERCHAAGVSVDTLHAEVVRMRFSSDRGVLLTTECYEHYTSSVMILSTGHNAPQDHYGLSASKHYVRDPYARFAFPDREGIEVGVLGSGLTAVDSATALASTPKKSPRKSPDPPKWRKRRLERCH